MKKLIQGESFFQELKEALESSDAKNLTIAINALMEIKQVNINEFGFCADCRIGAIVDKALSEIGDGVKRKEQNAEWGVQLK